MAPHIDPHVFSVPGLSDLVKKAPRFFDSTPLCDPNDLLKFEGPGVTPSITLGLTEIAK